MNRNGFSLMLVFFVTIAGYAAPITIPVITRVLHSPTDSFANPRYMLKGPRNSFYVSGYSSTVGQDFVSRLDSAGSIIWKKDIPGSNGWSPEKTVPMALTPDSGIIFLKPGTNSDDSSSAFCCVNSSGVEEWTSKTNLNGIAGMVEAPGGGWFVAFGNRVAKLSAAGVMLWMQIFSNPLFYTEVQVYGIGASADSGVFATGELKPRGGWGFLWYAKINAAGSIEWQKNLIGDSTGSQNESYMDQARGLAIQELPDRSFFVYGSKRNSYQSWLIKVNRNGDTAWTQLGRQRGIYLANMQKIEQGKILVSSGDGNSLLCIDTGGNKLWEKSSHFGTTPYVTGAIERANSIVVYGGDRIPTSSLDTIALRVIEFIPTPHMSRFVITANEGSATHFKCEISFNPYEAFKYSNFNPDFDITRLDICSHIYLDKLRYWVPDSQNIRIRWNSDSSGLIVELDSMSMEVIRNANPKKAIFTLAEWGNSDTVSIEGLTGTLNNLRYNSSTRSAIFLTPKGFGYELVSDSHVMLRIVDLQGRTLWQTSRVIQKAGRYSIALLSLELLNRSCILEMNVEGQTYTSRMTIVR